LSYPLAADGSEPALSDVFRYVDALFCTPQDTAIPREKSIPQTEWEYVCSAPVPAVRKLLELSGALERGDKDNCVWHSSIYTALDKLSVTEKYDYMPKAEQDDFISHGEELFLRDGKISPTALEGYFACPFRHFVERGLKLKAREETAVLAVDTGNFIHELLQETTVKAETIQTEQEMYAFALEKGNEILARPVYAMQSDTASGEVFSDKLLQEGAQVAVAAYRQIKRSAFKVEETEKGVDAEFFRGKVDRVDGTEKYVRIIDYKTGSIDDSATSYYTGRKLQMQLYMSSLQGERTPAGVFYFPASLGYAETDEGRFKMKGFLNGDKDAVLCGDTTLTDGGSSDLFPATLAERSTSKRMMDESTFRDFIDYSVHVARKGVSELKQGFVAPTPYDNACSYCKYGGMCGFNKESCTPRKENTIDTTAIAEIARKKREGGND
jgi:ATP-dependent helicase/nuclease subunit B